MSQLSSSERVDITTDPIKLNSSHIELSSSSAVTELLHFCFFTTSLQSSHTSTSTRYIGSYVSFKESAGDNSLSQSLSALSDSPFKDSDAPMSERRLRSGSFGNVSQGGGPGFDSLNFFPNGRGIDQANPSPYSALLNSTTSQRESAIAQREAELRERERFGGNPNGFGYDFRQQYPGGPPGPGHIDMEREREQRITAAARFNAASNSGNLAMTPQQQQLQLMQMTSRYPRLFPSASGGLAQPTGPGARAPGPSTNSAAPVSNCHSYTCQLYLFL